MAGELESCGVRGGLSNPKAVLAELQEFARSRGGWTQLLDAGHVLGRDHLQAAFEHARRAFEQGTNTTDSVGMEFLLYVSGERQISKAIDTAGVRARRPFVVVASGGVRAAEVVQRFKWPRDDEVMKATPAKLRALGFSLEEIRSAGPNASDLVLERVARVDLLK